MARIALLSVMSVLGWFASAPPVWAGSPDLAQSKGKAAEVVTLARVGAVLCQALEVDEAAVRELMKQAGISDRDVTDPAAFGSSDLEVARSFARSFLANPGDTCEAILLGLAIGSEPLLHRAGKPI